MTGLWDAVCGPSRVACALRGRSCPSSPVPAPHSAGSALSCGPTAPSLCAPAPAWRCPMSILCGPRGRGQQALGALVSAPLVLTITPTGSHSYRHLYTAVSDPSPDVPHFTAVSYMDDQQILHYDSETQREEPRGDWVQGAVDQDFWEGETMSLRAWQRGFKRNLRTLQYYYNQTEGSHTLQFTYGCELHADGSTGGHMQLGYDGADFISYDLATRTWVAAPAQAQRTQHTWNEEKAVLQDARSYLEETCITWLRQYLRHGEAALQSRRPVAQVSDRPSSRDGRTTLSCRVHGFYPRDVAVVWLKDGEAQPQETRRSGVLPSGDGTYQTRATIEMDPSSDHDYTCRVEHESLGAALRVAWDKGRAGYDPVMIVGGVMGAMLLVGAMTGTAGYFLRRRGTKPVRARGTSESESLHLSEGATPTSTPALKPRLQVHRGKRLARESLSSAHAHARRVTS